MNKFALVSTVGLGSVLVLAVACGDNSTSSSSSTSSASGGGSSSTSASSTSASSTSASSTSSTSSSSSSGTTDGGTDGGTGVNGCTSFTDVSGLAGGNPSIVWTNGGDFNNGPVCLRITQTHTVTFNTLTGMTFVNHPIKAAGSGTTPTPFPTPPAADAVTTKVFTFPNVGTYGFQCNIHSGSMIGAIKVDGN